MTPIMLTLALLFVLTRLLGRYAQDLLKLHECIVAEYIYAERAKDGATGLLAFASAAAGKIMGTIPTTHGREVGK